MDSDIIREIFNVLSPYEALAPGDPRYVECGEERGSSRLLRSMVNTIRFSKQPTSHILGGQRGSGRTTELFRLHYELTRGETPYFVVYCEADRYLDLSDVEFPDVLLAMVQQVFIAAREAGIEPHHGRLESILSGAEAELPEPVRAREMRSGPGFLRLGEEIRRNPENRWLVRRYLGPRASDFMTAVNDLLRETERDLRERGHRGLVIIVDNLDRISRTPRADTDRTSLDALFVDAGEYLSGAACHTVYTVPTVLLHSPNGATLPSQYSQSPGVLPMIPIRTRSGEWNEAGLAKLREVVQRRLQQVGTNESTVFDTPETLRRLCQASGGHFRSLMTFTRSTVNYIDRLPITGEAVEQAIRDVRDTYARSIRSRSQWDLLRSVAETHTIPETEGSVAMLDNLSLLEYRDPKGPWYDVNPVLGDLARSKT